MAQPEGPANPYEELFRRYEADRAENLRRQQQTEAQLRALTAVLEELTQEERIPRARNHDVSKFVRKPPNYSGPGSEPELESWTTTIKSYISLCDVPLDSPQAVKIAVHYLDGAALEFWQSLVTTTNDELGNLSTLDEFFTYMLDIDGKPNKVNEAFEALFSLSQKGTGSFAKYVNEFQAKRAYLASLTTDQLLLLFFKRGLMKQTRQLVELKDPKTTSDAITIASAINKTFVVSEVSTSNRFESLSKQRAGGDDPMDLSASLRTSSSSAKGSKGFKGTKTRYPTPKRADKTGDRAPYIVKSPREASPARSAGSSGSGRDKSTVKCYNCGKMGHFANECKVPKQPKN